jgi:hypothetical protein
VREIEYMVSIFVHGFTSNLINKWNKGSHRAKHATTTACRNEKVEEVYINSKCGRIILLVQINYKRRDMLDTRYFGHLSCTISNVKHAFQICEMF